MQPLSEETVTFNLELNVEKAIGNIRQLETLLYRSLALVRRLCGNEDVDAAILKFQRLTMTVRLLHSAFIMLDSATGPIGWAIAIIGFIGGLVTAGEMALEMTS